MYPEAILETVDSDPENLDPEVLDSDMEECEPNQIEPKQTRDQEVMCQPTMTSCAISCKPILKHQGIQTGKRFGLCDSYFSEVHRFQFV